MKFSKNKFTKHQIVESVDDTAVWAITRVVWCKLDRESDLIKRSQSRLRVFYVWLVSEDLKSLQLLELETAKQKLSPPEMTEDKKVVLSGKSLNTVLSKIKSEKAMILATKIRDAVQDHNNLALNNGKDGWGYYQYDYAIPLPILVKGKKILTINYGQHYKIMRILHNDNKLVFLPQSFSSSVYNINDQKLAILYHRSRLQPK